VIAVCHRSLLFLTVLFFTSLAFSQTTSSHRIDASQKFFKDDRIRVAIPSGWSLHTATEHVSGDKPFELPIGALLTKGKYRIYLLTHQSQASGIEGGRFSEIVNYVSPWIDMSESSWPPCSPLASEAVATRTLSRDDFYFDTTHSDPKAISDCGNPRVKGTLWYGSYFVETCRGKDIPRTCGGFFLIYQDLSGKPPKSRTVHGSTSENEWEMVYTITYDTATPDALPKKNDPRLQAVLKEANQIVESIVYK
jgi:hypothetical protein